MSKEMHGQWCILFGLLLFIFGFLNTMSQIDYVKVMWWFVSIPEAFVDASAQYVLSEMNIPGMEAFHNFDPNAQNNFERDDF